MPPRIIFFLDPYVRETEKNGIGEQDIGVPSD